jgi:cytochrome c553
LLSCALAATSAGAAPPAPAPKLSATCAACHGQDGNSGIPMFPKIAGQQEDYIVKQLRDFQSGRRKSNVMAPVVATLSVDDMMSLAQYYSKQKVKPTPTGQKQSVAFGKLVYVDGDEETGLPACIGCHKASGSGHLLYPRIGGQHAQYVAQQLKSFATGDRANDVSHFMRVAAKRMTEEELQSVADYLAGLDEK